MDKRDWLKQYSQYCTGEGEVCEGLPNIPWYIKKNPTRQNVMRHFLGDHNEIAYYSKNFFHMCIPYIIEEGDFSVNLKIPEYFLAKYREIPENIREKKLSNLEIGGLKSNNLIQSSQDISAGDILYYHVLPVDYEKR